VIENDQNQKKRRRKKRDDVMMVSLQQLKSRCWILIDFMLTPSSHYHLHPSLIYFVLGDGILRECLFFDLHHNSLFYHLSPFSPTNTLISSSSTNNQSSSSSQNQNENEIQEIGDERIKKDFKRQCELVSLLYKAIVGKINFYVN